MGLIHRLSNLGYNSAFTNHISNLISKALPTEEIFLQIIETGTSTGLSFLAATNKGLLIIKTEPETSIVRIEYPDLISIRGYTGKGGKAEIIIVSSTDRLNLICFDISGLKRFIKISQALSNQHRIKSEPIF